MAVQSSPKQCEMQIVTHICALVRKAKGDEVRKKQRSEMDSVRDESTVE